MWMLGYSREVRNYIYDSYPYTAAVWQAIKSLRQTKDGLPPSGWRELEPDLYLWLVVDHWVVYKRLVAEQKLVITVLKPMDEAAFDDG
jgi:hypothetical protein